MFAFPLKLQVEALKGRGPGRNKEDRGVFIPKCLKVSHRLFRTRALVPNFNLLPECIVLCILVGVSSFFLEFVYMGGEDEKTLWGISYLCAFWWEEQILTPPWVCYPGLFVRKRPLCPDLTFEVTAPIAVMYVYAWPHVPVSSLNPLLFRMPLFTSSFFPFILSHILFVSSCLESAFWSFVFCKIKLAWHTLISKYFLPHLHLP